MLKERVLYHQWWFPTPHPPLQTLPIRPLLPHLQGTASCLQISPFSTGGIEEKPTKVGRVFLFIQCIKFCINKGSICECWIGCCTLPLFFSSKEINSFLLFGYIWLHIDFRKRNKYHHYLLLSLSLCRSDPQCGTECWSGRIRGMTNGETSHGPCLLPLVAIIPTYHIYH